MRVLTNPNTIINNIKMNHTTYAYDIDSKLKQNLEFLKLLIALECNGHYIGRKGAKYGFLSFRETIRNYPELLHYKMDLLLAKPKEDYVKPWYTWAHSSNLAGYQLACRFFTQEDFNPEILEYRLVFEQLLNVYPEALFAFPWRSTEKNKQFLLAYYPDSLPAGAAQGWFKETFSEYDNAPGILPFAYDTELVAPIVCSDLRTLANCHSDVKEYLAKHYHLIPNVVAKS